MKLKLIAVGKNMPQWVTDGFLEYSKRFPKPFSFELIEVSPGTRLKNSNIQQIKAREADNILQQVTDGEILVALDQSGKAFSTEQLATQLQSWREKAGAVSFVIGGPDGLDPSLLKKAHSLWSLSPLTFPHPLVRIILVEQLYRAWSILAGHPYHK